MLRLSRGLISALAVGATIVLGVLAIAAASAYV